MEEWQVIHCTQVYNEESMSRENSSGINLSNRLKGKERNGEKGLKIFSVDCKGGLYVSQILYCHGSCFCFCVFPFWSNGFLGIGFTLK
uniref:Uncharacterized protein n=1 Tax=Glycine max TaxID=3847 RepID=A0A0R0EGX2_SOYBN